MRAISVGWKLGPLSCSLGIRNRHWIRILLITLWLTCDIAELSHLELYYFLGFHTFRLYWIYDIIVPVRRMSTFLPKALVKQFESGSMEAFLHLSAIS